MRLPLLARESFARRRAALGAALNGQPALLAAGWPRPRNYPANSYPFRPHSHFLYFLGWGSPGAMALFEGDTVTLFLAPGSPDDALWSGPSLAPAGIGAALGVAVASLDELDRHLAGRRGDVATLPAPDAETLLQQGTALGRALPAARLDGIDAVLADAVIGLRLIHDGEAIAELRRAAESTAWAHRAGMRATKPGIRESVVCAAMEAELTARGCATAYGSIVTVHGEILHNEAHHNFLEPDDLLLADVGAETEAGWAGDVTRTWPVAGSYSSEQADLYDVVLGAQRAAIAAVGPGVEYRDIHALATRSLATGLRDLDVLQGDPAERALDGTAALLFPHGVGHLLGLDVHDMEDLGDRAGYASGRHRSTNAGTRYLRLDRTLAAGMAVTIEPGLYFVPALLDDTDVRRQTAGRVNWALLDRYRRIRGIRIEDDVLVTPGGAEVLTAAIPKTRGEIETVLTNR